ncbi:unnamed protein product [Closterium sp. NIES-65]|nr:unnamed protein product [Closterium sp. NIES-65]
MDAIATYIDWYTYCARTSEHTMATLRDLKHKAESRDLEFSSALSADLPFLRGALNIAPGCTGRTIDTIHVHNGLAIPAAVDAAFSRLPHHLCMSSFLALPFLPLCGAPALSLSRRVSLDFWCSVLWTELGPHALPRLDTMPAFAPSSAYAAPLWTGPQAHFFAVSEELQSKRPRDDDSSSVFSHPPKRASSPAPGAVMADPMQAEPEVPPPRPVASLPPRTPLPPRATGGVRAAVSSPVLGATGAQQETESSADAPFPPPPPTSAPVTSAPVPAPVTRAAALRARNALLRRYTDAVLETVTRDPALTVTILMEEKFAAEKLRSAIHLAIMAKFRDEQFPGGVIPLYETSAGDLLKLPRASYGRQLYAWPTAADARVFRDSFPMRVRLADGQHVELRVFHETSPGFASAKAQGATTILVRNLPDNCDIARVRDKLLSGRSGGHKWLATLEHFHRVKNPFTGFDWPQFAGIVTPVTGDPDFAFLPPVLLPPNPLLGDPMYVHLSCHTCAICASNHRTIDHEVFAVYRAGKAPNPSQLTVLQLQQHNGTASLAPVFFSLCCAPLLPFPLFCLRMLRLWSFARPSIALSALCPLPLFMHLPALLGWMAVYPGRWAPNLGQTPAIMAVRADPGLLLIGMEYAVEPWTCSLCDFVCGPALDSALDHLRSAEHVSKLNSPEGVVVPRLAQGNQKAARLVQHPTVAAFLASQAMASEE